ncbi:MAG TPA: hypothetical protein PLE66_05145 [Thauera aminoaromatica]|nr:hypothetical protein [Thauera aminoaromatica]HMZ29027.1 hypothetical protein [Thauera aminoaromatica]
MRSFSAGAQHLVEGQGLRRPGLVHLHGPDGFDAGARQRELEVAIHPVAEHHHRGPRPLAMQLRHDAGHQDRALAHPARSIKDRQRGREQVGDDHPLVALAPEEEGPVGLLEGLQADVGATLLDADLGVHGDILARSKRTNSSRFTS